MGPAVAWAPRRLGSVICPSCGTPNRDEAFFCKYCGFDLTKAPKPVAPAPPTAAPPPPVFPPSALPVVPRPPRPRVWWHGIGVFVLVSVAFLRLDLAANRRITWSVVAVLSTAFIVGGIMILQHLVAGGGQERRPLYAGVVLLVAAVILLPVAIELQSSPPYTQTITVPNQGGVSALALSVSDAVGHVSVAFAPNPGFLAQAVVTHIGGLFSNHYPGDVTNSTSVSGGTLSFGVTANSVSGLFFLGGHDIAVTLSESVPVSMVLSSTTGNIEVTVPHGVHVASGGISATVTTGNVAILTTNPVFDAGASLVAESTTGQITLSINQTVAVARSAPVPVTGTSTTGSISFTFVRGTGVAAQVTSTVTTGSVNYASTKYSGTSTSLYAPDEATYAAAALKFAVNLGTTTGSINLG